MSPYTLIRLLPVLLAALMCAPAQAADPAADMPAVTAAATDALRHKVEARFAGSQVKSVEKTPYAGLYEVYMDGNIFYTDEGLSFLIIGNLIDSQSGKNLTQQKLRRLTAIDTGKLPLDLAIKRVKGDGKRTLIIVSDPLCPYCQALERTLAGMDNLTIYVLLYPLEKLHPGATELARAIWCSPDRAAAWEGWMLNKRRPPGRADCGGDPVARIVAAGDALGVNSTPTLVFGDGGIVPGVVDAPQLGRMLDDTPPAP